VRLGGSVPHLVHGMLELVLQLGDLAVRISPWAAAGSALALALTSGLGHADLGR